MKLNHTLLLSISLLALCSCSHSTKTETDCEIVAYDPNAGNDLFHSDLIRDVELIPLQTSDSSLIGTDPELLSDGREFFLIDRNGSQTILRYDAAGRFLNRIGSRGKGPQEYLTLSNVYIDSASGKVTIFSNLDSKICTYHKDGTFSTGRKTEHPFTQGFPAENDSYWLYLGYQNGTSDQRIMKIDAQDRITAHFLDATANVMPVEERFPVFIPTVDGQLWLRESLDNQIGILTGTNLTPVYRFDFGNYNIPTEYYTQSNPTEAAMQLMKQPFTILDRLLESRNYLIIQAHIQRPDGQAPTLIYAIKHKPSTGWHWFNIENPAENHTISNNSIRALNKNDELLCLVDPLRLLETTPGERTIFQNPELIDSLNEESNPVILKCRLK